VCMLLLVLLIPLMLRVACCWLLLLVLHHHPIKHAPLSHRLAAKASAARSSAVRSPLLSARACSVPCTCAPPACALFAYVCARCYVCVVCVRARSESDVFFGRRGAADTEAQGERTRCCQGRSLCMRCAALTLSLVLLLLSVRLYGHALSVGRALGRLQRPGVLALSLAPLLTLQRSLSHLRKPRAHGLCAAAPPARPLLSSPQLRPPIRPGATQTMPPTCPTPARLHLLLAPLLPLPMRTLRMAHFWPYPLLPRLLLSSPGLSRRSSIPPALRHRARWRRCACKQASTGCCKPSSRS
jgi:hypothetical protein